MNTTSKYTRYIVILGLMIIFTFFWGSKPTVSSIRLEELRVPRRFDVSHRVEDPSDKRVDIVALTWEIDMLAVDIISWHDLECVLPYEAE